MPVRRLISRCLTLAVVASALATTPATAAVSTGPAVVGWASNTGTLEGALAVAVSGHYAYTTAYWPGQLTVLDISNPASPQVVGATPATPSLENGDNVTVAGNYAFVTSKNRNASYTNNDDGSGNSLTVVDISNPAAPTVSGTVHDPSELMGAYGIAISGHYAFVAAQGVLPGQPASPDTSTGDLAVIDLDNLAAGVVAHIDNNALPAPYTGDGALDHTTSVAISGRYAYLTAYNSAHVTVVDISNPLAPALVYTIADWNRLQRAEDLAVQGGYLYVADQIASGNQFTVLGLANPAKPRIAAVLSDNAVLGGAYRLRVRGDFAYIAASDTAAVAAIDITSPTAPRVAGYVADTSHLWSASGLDLDPTGHYVVAASPQLNGQHSTPFPPYPSGTVNGTIAVIQLDPNPISVSISPASEPGQTTTVDSASFSFATDDDVSAVACALDAAALAPCASPTSQAYPALTPGPHTFTVQATDSAGATASDSYRWTVNAPPRATTLPMIVGTPSLGVLLRGQGGSWSAYPAPRQHYGWERCDRHGRHCRTIRRAAGATYRVSTADVGHTLRFVVRATNRLGSGSATSPASAVVTVTIRASLSGLLAGSPRLKITISDPRHHAKVTRVVIALPGGVRTTGPARALASEISATSGRRHIAVRVAVSGSVLTLTLARPEAKLVLTVPAKALSISAHLVRLVRGHRVRSETVSIAFEDTLKVTDVALVSAPTS